MATEIFCGENSQKNTLGSNCPGRQSIYLRAIELVVQAPNEYYSAHGKGDVEYASNIYGGKNLLAG
jgi:aldehyde:ferredoxin oxidoreductase